MRNIRNALGMGLYAYLFFLSITMMGSGMKHSFKEPVKQFLETNADSFTELASFVVGVLGTSLVQSSSTVTSMAVVLTQEGIVPLVISIGIVHGANLGTSVTSSLVALASEIRPLTGNPIRDIPALLFKPRLPGFHRAVSTAVVHGLFNAILVTGILIALELPFGLIHKMAEASAETIALGVGSMGAAVELLDWVSPKTYTKPVVKFLEGTFGMPAWSLVLLSFGLLFASLKGFATTVKRALLDGQKLDDHDVKGLEALGHRLLGRNPIDTFVRGLILTILVQSSSATTSMVVPLAALGLFSIRQVFPFIMGANIGTTTTAIIAASGAVGQAGFAEGMTIALCHFYLNCLAVAIVAVVPGVQRSVLGATQWLADYSERWPATLVCYLLALSVGMPLIVYFLPNSVAWGLLGLAVLVMLVGPHLYLRRVGDRDLLVPAK